MGFGLGNNEMIDMDVMVAEFYGNKTYRLYDMWSSKNGKPSNDTVLNGNYDLTDVQYSFVNEMHTLSFVRKLNTGDRFDNIIEKVIYYLYQPVQDKKFHYAWGDNKAFGYHSNNVGSSTFSITKDDVVIFSGENIVSSFDFFLFHGISLLVTWILLNFLGIFTAKFLKHLTYWIWLHRLFSGSAAIITIIFGSLGLYYSIDLYNSKVIIRMKQFLIFIQLMGSLLYVYVQFRLSLEI